MSHDYASDPTLNTWEVPIAQAGLCVRQTGYGLPWMTYCKEPRGKDGDLYFCGECLRYIRDAYGPGRYTPVYPHPEQGDRP